MTVFDIYRGKVAVRQNGRWYWAVVAPGFCAVARTDSPNRHHAICRNGELGHIVPNAERFVLIGALLSEKNIEAVDTVKFGLVATIDSAEEE